MTPSPVPSISTELLASADGELNRELHVSCSIRRPTPIC